MSEIHLDHIGIAVRSLEKALVFYQDTLGLAPRSVMTVAKEQVRVAMLPMGTPHLELLQAMSPESAVGQFVDTHGEGIHHVAIRVPNLVSAAERIKSSGAELVTDKIQVSPQGYRYVFVHPNTTGGVLLELIEE